MLRAGLSCLPLAPPIALQILSRGAAEGQTGDWFKLDIKLTWLVMTLRDRWQALDVLSVAAVLAALIYFIRSDRFAFSRNLGASALFLLAAFICLPRVLFGSAYADMRLIPFIFMIALAAVRPTGSANYRTLTLVAGLAMAFFTARRATNTATLYVYDRLHSRVLAALDHIPRGARLVVFVGRDPGVPWYSERTEHIAALAIVRRHAFSNDQWILKGAQLLTIRKQDAPGFDSDPSQMVRSNDSSVDFWNSVDQSLATFPRDAFDYVWLIKVPPFDSLLLGGLERLWSNETGAVYRVVRREGPVERKSQATFRSR